MAKHEQAAEPVLVVDLDGTLCRTDTLHEAILGFFARQPMAFLRLSLAGGSRARFKTGLADLYLIEAEALPFNETVLERVRAARAAGRRTALVSAADHRQVRESLLDDGINPDHVSRNYVLLRHGPYG